MKARIIATALFLAGTASALGADSLRIMLPEYAPYTSMRGGTAHGIGVDKVVPLLAAQGLVCTFSSGSFSEAVEAIKRGECDGFFLASKSPERDAVAILVAPVVYNNWSWYFSSDSKLDPSAPQFPTLTVVGTVSGSAQAAWLSKREFHTRLVPSADVLPAMLINHQGINSILGPELVINEAIGKAGFPLEKFRSLIADRKPFGIYLAKPWVAAHPALMQKIKDSVAVLAP